MNINSSNISMSYEVFRINISISDRHTILYHKLSSGKLSDPRWLILLLADVEDLERGQCTLSIDISQWVLCDYFLSENFNFDF
jgi:hypothetical protein